ncbi:4-coumarate--CoA ligase-like isoform X1 [Daphnia pulex]|uniref:4-coumarate--CoA ligase-like isoform X1 n=1 Tax=Daphnia pulex TaxID=6669 RepID=UPI001EDD5E23|nr:4-coumarate--CoA ligase-like isoform X1 [Daphnia pulex]
MPIVDGELTGEGAVDAFDVPDVALGIYIENCIRKNVTQYGDCNWLMDVSTGKSMKYSQLLTGMKAVASALRKRGLATGDNLVAISGNHIELPLLSMAVWRAGGTQSCLSVNLPQDVMEWRIREMDSKFVVTDYARAGRIVDVVQRLDFVREIFLIGDQPVAGCTLLAELLDDPGDECPENLNSVDVNSTAWLAYTSGTTGAAKCIVLSHRSIVGWFMRYNPSGNLSGTKFLFVNNMNNTGGLSTAVGSSLCHFDLYCMSDFSEEKLLAAIDRVKPRGVSLFPSHIAWLCKYPELGRFDLSSVFSLSVVGSLMNPIYERQIFQRMPHLLFLNNVYGMSETGLICQNRPPNPADYAGLDRDQVIAKSIANHVFGSVGFINPMCKLKVIDNDTGVKLGANQVGEICVKSPFMLTEYLNRPEETANFLRNGWAHTGDKGYYDDKERVFVIGRYKELIKYRNINILPTNVEKHMMTHPAIEDVAVVGSPHEEDGERPLAFVVLSENSKVTAEELISYTNGKVMEEEKLRGGIRFIEKIPRNDSGKIIRPALMKISC